MLQVRKQRPMRSQVYWWRSEVTKQVRRDRIWNWHCVKTPHVPLCCFASLKVSASLAGAWQCLSQFTLGLLSTTRQGRLSPYPPLPGDTNVFQSNARSPLPCERSKLHPRRKKGVMWFISKCVVSTGKYGGRSEMETHHRATITVKTGLGKTRRGC